MIADSVGLVSDGDFRKRVYEAALMHIRHAVAIASTQPVKQAS